MEERTSSSYSQEGHQYAGIQVWTNCNSVINKQHPGDNHQLRDSQISQTTHSIQYGYRRQRSTADFVSYFTQTSILGSPS